MSAIQTVHQHPASVDLYIKHGWSLVPIPNGTKGPRTAGWNKRENALKSQTDLPQGYGIGLAHAFSGTMALDIDDWESAKVLLEQSGVDIDVLYNDPTAVIIDRGRAGPGKLLYKIPFGLTLPSKKVYSNGITSYELRCATANGLTVQDVLPPSIHPETNLPYRWAGNGSWNRLPDIPASLLNLWNTFLEKEKERNLSTGEPINASWEEIKSALEYIPADCSREEWINVGMALHWASTQIDDVDTGLAIWNEWSAQSPTKYPGQKVIVHQWSSLRSDKGHSIRLGTLFHYAKQHGWVRPPVDASEFFKAVEEHVPISPIDLLKGMKPPVPDMDLDLWPHTLALRARQVAESVGCDPLVPLFAGLSAVCAVVDARTRLELMQGFLVPPVLWLMTIGEPADKKSPGSRPMFGVLKAIEVEDLPRFKAAHLDYQGRRAFYDAQHKLFIDHHKNLNTMDNDAVPTVPPEPEEPQPMKLTVQDITSQKLVRHAAERPRGLLCYLDEMNSWVKKMTEKTSGEDRSTWVVSYESESYEMDRVGSGSIHADNLAVSVYGNIQPRVYRENLANLSADGLLQRFIPAILRGDQTKLGQPIPEFLNNQAQYEQMLRLVYALPVQTYKLSPEAFETFRDFQRWYEATKADERLLCSSDAFMTAFGKLEGTTGRLILLFQLMENPFSLTVSKDLVERVIKIVRNYVIPAFRYSLGEVGGVGSFDAWLTDHVIQYCDQPSITLSDIKRSARRRVENMNPWSADQMVIGAMQPLEQAGWVIRMDDGSRETQHQAQWAINPRLITTFKVFRDKIAAARERQHREMFRKE